MLKSHQRARAAENGHKKTAARIRWDPGRQAAAFHTAAAHNITGRYPIIDNLGMKLYPLAGITAGERVSTEPAGSDP